MLKIEVNSSVAKVRDLLRQVYLELHSDPRARALILYYDVDPQ